MMLTAARQSFALASTLKMSQKSDQIVFASEASSPSPKEEPIVRSGSLRAEW